VKAEGIARFLDSAPVALAIGAVILVAIVGGVRSFVRARVQGQRIAAWVIALGFAVYVFGDLLARNWPLVVVDGLSFLVSVGILLVVTLRSPPYVRRAPRPDRSQRGS
jgi:hypothetical protein